MLPKFRTLVILKDLKLYVWIKRYDEFSGWAILGTVLNLPNEKNALKNAHYKLWFGQNTCWD